MTGSSCSIGTCKNNYYKQKTGTGEQQQIAFFTFPKDEKLKKIWISRCNRKDSINVKTAIVCSAHFKKDAFIDDIYARLTGTKPKLKLKDGIIPTEKLKPNITLKGKTTSEHSNRSQRAALSEHKLIIKNILEHAQKEDTLSIDFIDVSKMTSRSNESNEIMKKKYGELIEENKKLKEKLEETKESDLL